MARFSMDSQEVALPIGTSSVRKIQRHGEKSRPVPNVVVRHIQIDDFPMYPSRDEKPDGPHAIGVHETVEIFTGTVMEVAHDSIAEALEYLDRIEAAIPSLAMDFRDTPGPEGFQNLLQLYKGLYWVNILLDRLEASFRISTEDVFIQGVPVPEHRQKLISILKRLIESQARRRFLQIPDILQREVAPLVPVWKEMFSFFSKKVNEQGYRINDLSKADLER